MLKYLWKNLKMFFSDKKLKKPPQKVAYLWQLGGFFLCSPDCPKQLELHFRFINSFIQSSLLRSLIQMYLVKSYDFESITHIFNCFLTANLKRYFSKENVLLKDNSNGLQKFGVQSSWKGQSPKAKTYEDLWILGLWIENEVRLFMQYMNS